ncbi:MAG: dihydropteroate synthase [Lachnospiraceae bacterium]|nr:dihydropteroate synthase [Lachnospiraceae bacterium]
MIIGNREFDTENHTYVMGILNVTPDSFSDGGRWDRLDAALFHTEEMIAQGADIIDIGGESTRPGHVPVRMEEEMERVLPVIEKIKERFDVPLSLDTAKSQVAEAGIEAGADMINDIWGLKKDPDMARVIAEGKVACCLMHNKDSTRYGDFLREVQAELKESLALACKAGIGGERICIDPGVGFGKTYEHNLLLVKKLELFHNLECPILLGTSRKSVIGLTLDLPVEERLEGTLATTVIGVMKGAAFVRVHDIAANIRAIRMAEAIRNA